MQDNEIKSMAWELLYRTLVDCHKIATCQSKYFLFSGNRSRHSQENQNEVLAKARREIEEWINSDPFSFYAHAMGFKPEKAVEGAYAVLNGDIKIDATLLERPQENDFKIPTIGAQNVRIRNSRSYRNSRRIASGTAAPARDTLCAGNTV